MKRKLLYFAMFGFGISTFAQDWTRVHAEPDTLSPISIDYDNIGDTIIKRQRYVSNINDFYNFISLNGGQNFEYTASDIDPTFNPSRYGKLPINKKLIGYKNQPNLGSYLYEGGTNWSSIILNIEGLGNYFETGFGEIYYTLGYEVYSIDILNPNFSNVVHTFTESFELVCYKNIGNKTFFGLKNGKIAFIDNGDFSTFQYANVDYNDNSLGVNNIWKAGSTLYATIQSFYFTLLKSTDNGLNWTQVNTNSSSGVLNENKYINGTNDGRIYYFSDKAANDLLFVSTDGGINATQLSLPNGIDTVSAGYGLNKILINNNDVWLNIISYNPTDYSKPHPNYSGLWKIGSSSSSLISELSASYSDVYPNPFQDKIKIKTDKNILVNIISTEGKEVNSTYIIGGISEINTSNLECGTYIMKIIEDNNVISKLIIKN